ncbi:MAG: Ig-like domain-containing protein [Lentisphaeria bacterium]|nr:Ig-like domain-containing protein [Lentisphaeria bacterium]
MMRTNAGIWKRVLCWCSGVVLAILPSFPLAAQDLSAVAKVTTPAQLTQPGAKSARRADDDWFLFEYEVNQVTNTATVISYFGGGDVVIPDHDPDGHPVTAIAPDLFSANPFIDSISFPEQISFAADQLEQYLLVSYNLTALFFRGPAPAYLPTVSGRCVIYYPYNADAGATNPEATWAYRIEHSYPAARRYVPIAYPITAPPVIARSAGEPDENPDCFTDSLTIALSAEEGSVVRYTTDGTTPRANSASVSPVTITTSTLFEARAFRNIAGVLQPCSVIARRHFVNTNELRNAFAAVPTEVDVLTEGDVPWHPRQTILANGNTGMAASTGTLFSGQSSVLSASFTLTSNTMLSFNMRATTDDWQQYTAILITCDGQYLFIDFNTTELANGWKFFECIIPPGQCEMKWDTFVYSIEGYELAVTDFKLDDNKATLTLVSEPADAGSLSANGSDGSQFSFLIGDNVTIAAQANKHFLFDHWLDDVSAQTRIITIADPETAGATANTYTATFSEGATISTKTVPAHDDILVHGGNETYRLGTEVVLLPQSTTDGWRFVGWDDDDATNPVLPQNRTIVCSVADRDKVYTAHFTRVIHLFAEALYRDAENSWLSGGGSVNGAGSIDVSDDNPSVQITLTATPESPLAEFLGWDDNGNGQIDPTESRALSRNITLNWLDLATVNYTFESTALFRKSADVRFAFAQASDAQLGQIEISDQDGQFLSLSELQAGQRLPLGSQLTIKATPNAQNTAVLWLINDAPAHAGELSFTITIEEHTSVILDFLASYLVQIGIAEGQAGWGAQVGILNEDDDSLFSEGTFPSGSMLTIEARAQDALRFIRWSDGVTAPSRIIRVVDSPVALTAEFVRTGNVILDFTTDPAVLPEDVEPPPMRCRIGNDRFTFVPGQPGANTHVLDAGSYQVSYETEGDWTAPASHELTIEPGNTITLSKTFTRIAQGTFNCFLAPSGISGQWRLKGTEDWYDSRHTLSLNEGQYSVEFAAVEGWTAPAEQAVTITTNRNSSITASYTPIAIGVDIVLAPTEITENAGNNAIIGILRRLLPENNAAGANSTLSITLSSSDDKTIILPAEPVIIPAGQDSATFPIIVLDNDVVDEAILDEQENELGRGRQVIISGTLALTDGCDCNDSPFSGYTEDALAAELVVWDDESPALKVTMSPTTLPESAQPYPRAMTISRGGVAADQALTVELSAVIAGDFQLDPGTEMQFWRDGQPLPWQNPAEPGVALLVIPAGAYSINVDILACADGRDDGSRMVALYADATGFAPGSAWAMTSDLPFPDYTVAAITTPTTELTSSDLFPLAVTIRNVGNLAPPTGLRVPLAIHASRNGATSTNTLLLESSIAVTTDLPLAPGQDITVTLDVPLGGLGVADDWRFVAVVNHTNTLRELTTHNNQLNSGTFTLKPSYLPLLDAPTLASILPDQSLTLSGKVQRSLTDDTPVPYATVDIRCQNGAFLRSLAVTSDAAGRFNAVFTPMLGERGLVTVMACYPGTEISSVQHSVDILGLTYEAGDVAYLRWDLITDTPRNYSFVLKNQSTTALKGLNAMLVNARTGVTMSGMDLPDSIPGQGSVTVNYAIAATSPSPQINYERLDLRVSSSEGVVLNIPAYLYVINQNARMDLAPASIDTTMQIGTPRRIEVVLSNKGAAETGQVSICTPEVSWLKLPAGPSIANIPAGSSATIVLELGGDDSTPLGMPLSGTIAISAENISEPIVLPFRVTAVSADKGALQVTACDEYSFFTDNKPLLKNASVTVKNPYTGEILATGTTGDTGVCTINDLPVGKCLVLTSCEKHNSNEQLVDIAPGATAAITAYLQFQAISYSWDVVPTDIADEYEITLTIHYETNVPVPVVKTIMPSDFISMVPGETRHISAILVNEGLITALDVGFSIDDTSEFTFAYAFPREGIDLLAKQSVVVPVVVSRHQPTTRGGDCTTTQKTIYSYECQDEKMVVAAATNVALSKCEGIAPEVDFEIDGGPGLGGPSGMPTGSFGPSPASSIPSNCNECLDDLAIAAAKCALSFVPVIGNAASVIDAINSVLDAIAGKKSAASAAGDVGLAGLGFVPGLGNLANALGCGKGFAEACGGGGGGGGSGGGGSDDTRNASLREDTAPSWVLVMQEKVGWGYRQQQDHAAILVELYGDAEWLNCDMTQYRTFATAFKALAQERPDGSTPVVAANAPELLAVLPENITMAQLSVFVARWNRSMTYWLSLADGEEPAAVDQNGEAVINAQHLAELNDDIKLCEAKAREYGYPNTETMLMAQYQLALDTIQDSGSVCASITLEIKQQLAMTREAFEGTLTLHNGHLTKPITAIGLHPKITNAAGEDCTHLFAIDYLTDRFTAISAVDGTGTLAADSSGTAVIRFIPERAAAPLTPTSYNFGGVLTYLNPFSDSVATVPLIPCTLTVHPSPSLQLHYFLERDILGDDPLTENIVEPSRPAELSVLINNDGYGTARNVRMDSGQPQIIENSKGLLIDFALWDYQTTACLLNGIPNHAPVGQINLGDIAPKSTGLAQWWLTSSLLGHFVGMEARYSHLNSLGNPELSLIDNVAIHELIHNGSSLDDQTTAFLVNDVLDFDDAPDTLWFANDAHSEPVLTINHRISSPATLQEDDTSSRYVFEVEALLPGWHYLVMPDPGNLGRLPGRRAYELAGVTRSPTGNAGIVELPSRNCWLSDLTLRDGLDPVNDNRLHLLDYLEAGNYRYTVALVKMPDERLEIDTIDAISSNAEPVTDYLITGDINQVTVTFTTPIDITSFSSDDITLRREGALIAAEQLTAALNFALDPADPTNLSAIISGLAPLTNSDGFYILTIQCAGINDRQGFAGWDGRQLLWLRHGDGSANPEPPAPRLLGMERIAPVAGMNDDFTAQLRFSGHIDPTSVSITACTLLANGTPEALPEFISIAADANDATLFHIQNLGQIPADNRQLTLRFDASGVKDIRGTACVGEASISWSLDTIPPAPCSDLVLTPDSGTSATDGITQLPANDTLTISGTAPELPCTYQLFYTKLSSQVPIAITTEIALADDADPQIAIPFALPEGSYQLNLLFRDAAGNSCDNLINLVIDNTPPLPPQDISMTPDSGVPNDFITMLPAGTPLAIQAVLPETQLQIALSSNIAGDAVHVNNGNEFSLTAQLPLAEGSHDVTITCTDRAGNSNATIHRMVIDNTPPAPTALRITPDYGVSAEDGLTYLPPQESLSLHVTPGEIPSTLSLSGRSATAGDFTPLLTKALPLGTAPAITIPLPYREAGQYAIQATLTDLAGNVSPPAIFAIVIDAEPLTAVFSNVITSPVAADALTITFSAPIVSAELTTDALIVLANDLPMPGLIISRVSDSEFTISNIKPQILDDSVLKLTLNLAALHKLQSGLPGTGDANYEWQFTYDTLDASFAWELGWNAVQLPLSYLVPATTQAIAAMPRHKILPKLVVIDNGQLPMNTPLWVFCADPGAANTTAIRGALIAADAPSNIPAYRWVVCTNTAATELPPDWTVWRWQQGRFTRCNNIIPGYAHWIYHTDTAE